MFNFKKENKVNKTQRHFISLSIVTQLIEYDTARFAVRAATASGARGEVGHAADRRCWWPTGLPHALWQRLEHARCSCATPAAAGECRSCLRRLRSSPCVCVNPVGHGKTRSKVQASHCAQYTRLTVILDESSNPHDLVPPLIEIMLYLRNAR